MHAHLSSCLISSLIIQLDLKLCRGGLWSYSARLVLMSPDSSHMQPGQQQAYCTASHWAVSRLWSLPIGPHRVVSTTNFINVICNDICESLIIFCICILNGPNIPLIDLVFTAFYAKLHGVLESSSVQWIWFLPTFIIQLFSLPVLNIWFGSAIKYMNL